MCADPFHDGHVVALKEAAKLADIVIVGLMTDESMRSYKRPPIRPWAKRKEVLELIQLVDEIVPQTELDYRPNLRKIKPDFIVHGDDWRVGPQQEARRQVIEVMREWGGIVHEIPRPTDSFGSTEYISYVFERAREFLKVGNHDRYTHE
jgi:phosphoenolpyruvate phosphomutase